ncbi:MAG: hypothetical protein A3D46_02095 [Candidatus Nealsonbacteria bacterium RIFCSPHIGHO2_02_FULL_43_13]|uniref:Lipoprotein n=1 Tax=Candidatus Nealsonbacteria bacterium RIFCSPHIGHO2_02_FULL_43_13 TaxID=1801668 RepID=A0A1G2E895_9BACT|nr:MAG: hypothetical protein A3D46_02095 [Candidatus Nealsonbacteria bacterium RIFCSPHIGHO2_02_FULL_43_13]
MKKVIAVLAVIILAVAVLTSCSPMEQERNKVQERIAVLQKTQPIPTLTFSNTRDAVIRRINRWNDPNKISYIYLLSETGVVMSFFTVKGSVESKLSYLSPVYGVNGDYPDVDGTYGDNKDAIFFFTTDDVYVEWPGLYLWADQPLKLATQPVLIYTAPLK